MGHTEKKCKLRFGDGCVHPGKSFPYGEWLKVPAPSSRSSEPRSTGTTSSQNPGGLKRESSIRGLDTFDFRPSRRGDGNSSRTMGGKENELRPLSKSDNSNGAGSQHGQGSHEMRVEERMVVKPSQMNNRKKKVVELGAMDEDRQEK